MGHNSNVFGTEIGWQKSCGLNLSFFWVFFFFVVVVGGGGGVVVVFFFFGFLKSIKILGEIRKWWLLAWF